MSIQIPKNVRQIGEIHPEHKIYMEDYVITYFRQLCKKEKGPFQVVLYGKNVEQSGRIYHYIFAAAAEADGAAGAEYFAGVDIVGKAVLCADKVPSCTEEFDRTEEENRLLYFADAETENERFYLIQNGVGIPIYGYYIYYDKNDMMQNYLIDWYKENTVSSERLVRDRAAKTFRNVGYERHEEFQQKKIISLLYTASLMLVTLCCIAGVTMINQYDKMKGMERAIEHLAQALEEQKLPETQLSAGEKSTAEAKKQDFSEKERQTETEESAAETAQETPVLSGSVQTVYTVTEGDTLANICREHYGTSSKIAEVCEQNQIGDPNNITVGQKILLP